MAACSSAARLRGSFHEVDCIVCEIGSGTKLRKRFAGAVNSNISFEMTLEAGTVSPGRNQFGWVHNGTVSLFREVPGRISVAG